MLQLESCIRVDSYNNNHTTLILRNPTHYTFYIPVSGVNIVNADYSDAGVGISSVDGDSSAITIRINPYGTVRIGLNTTLEQGEVYYMVFNAEAGNLPSIKMLCA